ncbi:phosphoribosylanthranilate isomerase [Mesorhizobium sp. INR15]|uniref:phosphoribosylanthranilate isomerase n=1 Tax=Mesorhizobium sp. INR15 TaxID=2654248 RepID=UPI001896530F|nr:phosphoribosylanthranilate isomerase [Mesorhizobium sp. INR15]QPC94582.1 N-(5'-phosphoribosyl)anthranilate isomerase [Mesorhizobium sp. INR15]
MTVAVKICGITEVADAEVAADAGADFIGLVFSDSQRRVSLDIARTIVEAISPIARTIGVFVNESLEFVHAAAAGCHLDAVQLQGTETADYCARCRWPVFKGIHLDGPLARHDLEAYDVSAFVFDTHVPGLSGGTGKRFDWSWVAGFSARPFFLAGGLDPENVASAIARTHPYAVDVSSGVSLSARLKDPAKIRAFVTNAKSVSCPQRRDWAMPFLAREPTHGTSPRIS